MNVFNGKRIVAISHDANTVSLDEINDAFKGCRVKFITKPNNPSLQEATLFLDLLDEVQSSDPTEATFYAHAKGVTHPESLAVRKWAECMYHYCLDDLVRVRTALERRAMFGVSFKVETPWIYPGSFWWFHNASLFSKRDWRTLGNPVTSEGIAWSTEAFPNRFFPDDCERLYPPLNYSTRGPMALYDVNTWVNERQSPTDAVSSLTKTRWRSFREVEGITWGARLSGDPLLIAISIAARLQDSAVVEFGVGYGRLPEALRTHNVKVASFTGIDLSEWRIRKLREEFPEYCFLNADVESLGDKVGAETTDIVASFITFKHLYPDFGEAAKSAHRILVQGGVLAFDVPERNEYTSPEEGAIEPETGIFLRSYSRATIERILTEAGFRVRYFSEITHMSGKTRLLVCAAKE